MKTLFNFLMFGLFLTTVGASSVFAQADPSAEFAALFDKFKADRKAACGQRDAALESGRKIIAFSTSTDPKYKEVADLNKEIVDYAQKEVTKIAAEDPTCKRNDAYNTAYKAKDWAKFTSVSKEIIAAEGNSPLALDVMLTLASVGYDQAVAKVDTYNVDTINYAKQAIQRIEAGGASSTGKYGVFVPFQTKTYTDGKTNALNGLNYMVGWITYNRLGATDPSKKKEGLAYLYKSTQYNGEFKNDYTIYTSIGDYYFTEAARLDKEYRDIRTANNNTETDEAKAKRALAMGYADRGVDAFGRAKQTAIAAKATPKVVEAISKTLSDLYKFRFNLAPTAATPDLDKYVAGLVAKPMPDPATEPTPIVEEVAPTTTTSTTTTTTPAATTTSTTKTPATTTPASNATTTNKTTTPAKKPVTKKKGTR